MFTVSEKIGTTRNSGTLDTQVKSNYEEWYEHINFSFFGWKITMIIKNINEGRKTPNLGL